MNSGLKCATHTDNTRTIAGAYFHLQAPLDTGRKWNYVRRSENILDVFLTSYVRSTVQGKPQFIRLCIL